MSTHDPTARPPSDGSPGTPREVTCERYVRGVGKRCLNYSGNGTCALPDELMCVEWLRANGYAMPPPPQDQANTQGVPPALAELTEITAEDVESFKTLGVEVCLSGATRGDLWLVPEYTGQSRNEITPEDAVLVMKMLAVFPGANVVAFKRPESKKPGKGERP